MQSVHKQVFDSIKSFEGGTIFFSEQFEYIGSNDSVRKALSRICSEGVIIRLSKGVYLNPIIDKELGVLYPSVDKVAKAISERDKSRIIPTGIFALNSLGLSTQVPLKIIYLTDGIPRKVTVGNQTIVFRKTAPKNFAFQNKLISLIVSALKEIGKDKITENELEHLKGLLKREDKNVLISDSKLAPRWIADLILSFI